MSDLIDLDPARYTKDNCWFSRAGWGTSVTTGFDVSASAVAVDGGLDLTLTVKNTGTEMAPWPFPTIPLPIAAAEKNTPLDGRWVTYQERRWSYRSGDPFPAGDGGSLTDEFGRAYQAGPNSHLALAWAWVAGAQTIGIGCDYDRFCMVATAKVANELRVILDPTPNGNWPHGDLLPPGETRTIRVWIRVVDGTAEEDSLHAVQPYIDHMQTSYPVATVRHPHWQGGRILGHYFAGGGDTNANDRNYRATGAVGHQKTLDQCANLADAWDLFACHYGGSSDPATACATLKSRGVRVLMGWLIQGQREDFTNPAGLLQCLPVHLRSEASLQSIIDWQAQRRMLAGLYGAYVFSKVPVDVADWQADEESPSVGRYTLGSLEFHEEDPTDPALWSPPTQTTKARIFARENYHRAGRYFAALHCDALLDGIKEPWINAELSALLDANPTLHINGERGPRVLPDAGFSPDYLIDDDSYPYIGPCALKAAVHGAGYHHVVQCQGSTDNETAEGVVNAEANGATAVFIGGTPKLDGVDLPVVEADTFRHCGSAAAWETWFDGWIKDKRQRAMRADSKPERTDRVDRVLRTVRA